MDIQLDRDGQKRLVDFFAALGRILKHKRCIASFAIYALGLLSDGERKSVEPIAARIYPDPERCSSLHQRLLHMLNDSPWKDHAIRRYATQYALSALPKDDPILSWILDDTGFPKSGAHSVGVQRQYTGTLGKVTNCQVGPSLTLATATTHLPVDFELYLPKSWLEDPKLRKKARIPSDVVFRTKPELGLQMIRRAVEDGLPRGIVLADSAYGNSSQFRKQLHEMGLHYAVAIDPQTKVFRLDCPEPVRDIAMDVKTLSWAFSVKPKRFRRLTWRQGTKQPLQARFVFCRVIPAHDDGTPLKERVPVWLIIEWVDGESRPTKFYLAHVPKEMSKQEIVRRLKERWRTERVYEDLKGELGLDHFEGRRYPGWHHHISIVLCCNAFVVSERARRFPPCAFGTQNTNAFVLPA